MTESPAAAGSIPGYAPEDILTSEPTRSARLKWVVVVDESLPAGPMVNAVACISATTGSLVEGLIARGGPDASGFEHPGLPWAGCAVLAAPANVIGELQARAASSAGILAVDMPAAAQTHRVYDDYLAELAHTEPQNVGPSAVSIVGPKNRVDKMIKKLKLLMANESGVQGDRTE